MKHLIIIRGPAGVGKSTIGKLLKKTLGNALFFNIDMICSDIVGGHPKKTSNRFAAYELCLIAAKKMPKNHLIFERVFNHQKDIDRVVALFASLKYRVHIFTLHSTLKTLIKRDSKRPGTLGPKDVKRVHLLYTSSDVTTPGKIIEIRNKGPKRIVNEILLEIKK